ncbi:MAG: CHAD domain-containing protein [Methanomicrobiales archaeon]
MGLIPETSGAQGVAGPSLQPARVRGMCLYGANQLVPKIDALTAETNGVKEAEDIECIHRMRVASRRLRAAMPLFALCFPGKKYDAWLEEVRQITRVLGEARDIDVQVAFLKKFRKRTIAHQKSLAGVVSSPGTPLVPGIDYLLAGLKNRRVLLQQDVIASVERLEKRQDLSAMRGMAQSLIDRSGTGRKKASVSGIPPVAADHIVRQLDALLSFSPWVHHPDAIAEHHAMRIATKKLRYTMEVYAQVYRLGLRKPAGRVTQLQEILGNLHDCDVWIDRVTRILLKERSRLRPVTESNRPSSIEITGLKLFLANREKERTALYRKFVRYWETIVRSGTWNDLRQVLVTGVKNQYLPKGADIDASRLAVMQLAMVYPEGLLHSRRVTAMALALFDDLVPLHQMNERSRFLLECAAILHDIGWKSGKKGHGEEIRELILSDEHIPFGVAERSIISLVAGTHQGSQCPPVYVLFSILSPGDQQRTNILSALLRIADGLDFRHKGAVESAHCIIHPDRVECIITPTQDVIPEKQKAVIKAEFFEKLVGIPFFIV